MAEAEPPRIVDSKSTSEIDPLHARAAELTALSRHLILVAEEEKADLARELHDTFGSNLTAINMDLNWIAKRLPADRPELRERLQRAMRMLAETVSIKQGVIDRLRPSQLDTLGLAVALRTQCRDWANRSGGACEVEASDEFEALDRMASIALLRIAIDVLAILQERDGANVRFQLMNDPDGVRLRIESDGVVLARALAEGGAPVEMRERVGAVGGDLDISMDERRARIDAFVPTMSR